MGLKTLAFGAIFIVHVMSMFLSGGMAGSAAQHFHLGFFLANSHPPLRSPFFNDEYHKR